MADQPLHDMTSLRIGELRAEAKRARTAKAVRGSRGRARHLGFLGRLRAPRVEKGDGSLGSSEEACCA